jgi:hypothetical protein
MSELLNRKYKFLINNTNILNQIPHSTIRNYKQMVSKQNYICPEIGECVELPTGECIVILKTFWIRIIQRTWRNILKKRKQMIGDLSFLFQIQYSTHSFKKLPTLKGMLSC